MVDIIRLDPKFRGHGIGLLALDRLVKHVARASRDWKMEGLVVLNPSMMNDRRVQANTHEDVQQKLFEYYKLFGLEVLTKETSRHCALSVISWPNGGRTSRRSYHICCSRSLSEG
jgi:GNAT superfamily N-acetyltransferase